MGARPGLSFLSAGTHGRSRRFSVLAASWRDSCPNGVARDRRGTSCAPRDTPPLPGGGRGGRARAPILGAPSLGVGWAHGQVGRFSQRGRTGDPDGSPCWPPPGASRARTAWPETAMGPPARPETRRLCPAVTAEASPGARFPSRFRVVPRRGRPFLSHGAVGPSRGRCAPPTLRRRPSAGRGGRGPPRSSPGGAPPALNGRLAGRRRHARVMESTSKMYEKRGPRAPCSFFFVFRLQKFRRPGQDPPTAPELKNPQKPTAKVQMPCKRGLGV